MQKMRDDYVREPKPFQSHATKKNSAPVQLKTKVIDLVAGAVLAVLAVLLSAGLVYLLFGFFQQ